MEAAVLTVPWSENVSRFCKPVTGAVIFGLENEKLLPIVPDNSGTCDAVSWLLNTPPLRSSDLPKLKVFFTSFHTHTPLRLLPSRRSQTSLNHPLNPNRVCQLNDPSLGAVLVVSCVVLSFSNPIRGHLLMIVYLRRFNTATHRPWWRRQLSFSVQRACDRWTWTRRLLGHSRQRPHPFRRSPCGM
jgi:hypothetical protein